MQADAKLPLAWMGPFGLSIPGGSVPANVPTTFPFL
jgi:hypothetical protein